MNQFNENLSALHDGELDELGAMRILRSLDQSPEMLDEWELYSLIGESLRQNEPISDAGVLGAQRALAEIAANRVEPQIQSRVVSHRWIPLAIAASLSLLAVGLSLQVSEPMRSFASSMIDRGRFMVADAHQADPAEMDRYVDLHREVAVPGLQRASFVSADALGSQVGR